MGLLVTVPLPPEPVKVLAVIPMRDAIDLKQRGPQDRPGPRPDPARDQLKKLRYSPLREPFYDGPAPFRLGLRCHRRAARSRLTCYESSMYDPFLGNAGTDVHELA